MQLQSITTPLTGLDSSKKNSCSSTVISALRHTSSPLQSQPKPTATNQISPVSRRSVWRHVLYRSNTPNHKPHLSFARHNRFLHPVFSILKYALVNSLERYSSTSIKQEERCSSHLPRPHRLNSDLSAMNRGIGKCKTAENDRTPLRWSNESWHGRLRDGARDMGMDDLLS